MGNEIGKDALHIGESVVSSLTPGGVATQGIVSGATAGASAVIGAVSGHKANSRPSGLTLAEQQAQGGASFWKPRAQSSSYFNTSEHSGIGAVPPSQIAQLSDPMTKMAVASSRGFARTQLQQVGNVLNNNTAQSVLGTST